MNRACFALILGLASSALARPWSEDVIYFALTDRFADGDASNNVPPGSDPALYDASHQDISRYHGGDFRGLENAIASGYFNDLGVTAIWITPPVRNVWRSGFDLGGPKTGYHGYWAQDFLDIDPHLTSAKAFDGTSYVNGPDGRLKHYKDLVALAHSKGLKVIQDVVMNHAGPVFYYDANGNAGFDRETEAEWIQPYKRDGFHGNAAWADVPEWNLHRTAPEGPVELLSVKIPTNGILSKLETYSRKGFSGSSLGASDGEEVTCDFFSLRDLWTAPGSEHFDALVDEFVEIYAFYLTTIGVDGLRIDTVKHVHREFWDAFTERLRKKLGDRAKDELLFGEVYDDQHPDVLGSYTWRTDWETRKEPSLDSVLDFTFCAAAREYLRADGGNYGSSRRLEAAIRSKTEKGANGRPLYNPTPGPDGLNSIQKSITFLENHDGLNRFRVAGVTERRNALAQGLVMTMAGIPCLYYGTELGLTDEKGRIGQDGETGRLSLDLSGAVKGGPLRKCESFVSVARLTKARSLIPVLRTGATVPLWSDSPNGADDDGVFAFARVGSQPGDFAIVVINASDAERVTGAGDLSMLLVDAEGKPLAAEGSQLRRLVAVGPVDTTPVTTTLGSTGGTTSAKLSVPAQSLVIFAPVK
jgi:glycosidase